MTVGNQVEEQSIKRFLGLELSGPHANKTSLLVLDEYPSKLIVSGLHTDFRKTGENLSDSQDLNLLQHLESLKDNHVIGLCTQAPITLPPYFQNEEVSRRESQWMEDYWNKLKNEARPFLSYMNRPLDLWMRHYAPEGFAVPETMGANRAPLAVRLQFIQAQNQLSYFEAYPPSIIKRLVQSAGLKNTWAEDYTDLEKGITIRESFLKSLQEKLPQLFIYEHDLDLLIVNKSAFHSFLLALVLWMREKDCCEKRPTCFPKLSTWGLLPKQHIRWEDLAIQARYP